MAILAAWAKSAKIYIRQYHILNTYTYAKHNGVSNEMEYLMSILDFTISFH